MIKETQRDTKKNSNGPNGVSQDDDICEIKDDSSNEQTLDLKDAVDEAANDIRENLSARNSPNTDLKPLQDHDNKLSIKDVGSLLQSSCKILKNDGADNIDSTFRTDACDAVALNASLPPEVQHENVQPLPSNVINKQPVTMEAQYMQQQSQIFVFSTALANKAADAVLQGHFFSIIAYHCSQPRTKKYLEGGGHPNMNMPHCGGNFIDQSCVKISPNNHGINSPNIMPPQGNPMLQEGINIPPIEYNQDLNINSSHQPLTGVKVPDENLTPQQRQHREEQLATLRKMQQMLFPEALPGEEVPNVPLSNIAPPSVTTPQASNQIDDVIILSDNNDMNKPTGTSNDWQKMQMNYFEDQKCKRSRGNGPPPTYQQATRSASVPIALPSPNPASPSNATSNLSLPSPRTCSGINSPADKLTPRIPGPSPITIVDSPAPARSTNSNPPTPVSIHLSPKHKDKLTNANDFSPSSSVSAPNSQHSPADSVYCRSVQSIGPGKQVNNPAKEPNLMPVPSPQQIQYLNTFEGQELTIQKQPNTSLKEPNQKSPGSTNLDNVLPSVNTTAAPSHCNNGNNSLSANSSNTSNTISCNEMGNKITGPSTPSTPDITNRTPFMGNDLNESADKALNNQLPRKMDNMVPYCNSPQTMDRSSMNMQGNYLHKGPTYPDVGGKCNFGEKDNMQNPTYSCMGPSNMPLNPNGANIPPATKPSHFDPISSLAQMSQQLTNTVPNSPVNPSPMMPNMHQNIVPYNSPTSNNPHLMSMGEVHHIPSTPPDHRMQNQITPNFNNMQNNSNVNNNNVNVNRVPCNNPSNPALSVSPKLMQNYNMPPRPMARAVGYNGASVQVKPNAPNTIQYLPSRPQANVGPRGPPSLEFLQRFSNPLSNLDTKVPTHNLQYFPNNYPQGNMNDMGMCSPHGNVRPPMRPGNPGMMRMQSPQMPPMGYGNNEMYQNCQMYGPTPKPMPMGMVPDASQPLPPSMGQSNNFKSNTFVGPTTADPNYAQQFHNFQQQLYATNTRGQLTSQAMATNPHYFMSK